MAHGGAAAVADPHRRTAPRFITFLAFTALFPSGGAQAQPPEIGAGAGDRVRVTWCEEIGGTCEFRHRTVGVLLDRDSAALHLRVDQTDVRVPWSTVQRVEVPRASHGALRTVAFGVGGLLLGGAAGMALGTVVQGDCYEFGCLAGPAYGTVIGAPAGAIAGVAYAVRTREGWRTSYRR
jgi:hypothetical protein